MQMDIFFNVYETDLGTLTFAEKRGGLFRLYFGNADIEGKKKATPLLDSAALQLEEYADGKRHEFELPIILEGTPFQMDVWSALRAIPYGQTATYKQIAQQLGNPAACRAVGMANNKNPLAIIVPCHRVVGADGSLTGYAGGIELKRRLLDIERAAFV